MRDPVDTYMNYLVPMVVEQTNRGERAYDIYSRLLQGAHHLHYRAGRGRHGDRWSWRSFCSSRPRTRRRKSRCTSIRRAAW